MLDHSPNANPGSAPDICSYIIPKIGHYYHIKIHEKLVHYGWICFYIILLQHVQILGSVFFYVKNSSLWYLWCNPCHKISVIHTCYTYIWPEHPLQILYTQTKRSGGIIGFCVQHLKDNIKTLFGWHRCHAHGWHRCHAHLSNILKTDNTMTLLG